MEETINFLLSVWTFVTDVLRAICLWVWNLRWWQFWLLVVALMGAWIVHVARKRQREEARAEHRREKTKRYWPTTPLGGLAEAEHPGDKRRAPPSQRAPEHPHGH